MRILIVGNPETHHVGSHFRQAARSLGWEVGVADLRLAKSANRWVNRLFDRGFRRRPAHLERFGNEVTERCRRERPDLLVSTGVAPLSAKSLESIGGLGIRTVNFLTDDPWNPRNGAGFFWAALGNYDLVASPRRANLEDLRAHGCRRVEYLPFGYDPGLHRIAEGETQAELERFSCQVAILGGADADRLPLARALGGAGFDLALYGGYWDRHPELRRFHRGFVHGRELQLAVRLAQCQVCMGRKANRDGHAMRSIEFPAMGASLVTEDTEEHRELFGAEGEGTLYWKTPEELVTQVRRIVVGEVNGVEMAKRLHRRMTASGRHRYVDRLKQMASWLEG